MVLGKARRHALEVGLAQADAAGLQLAEQGSDPFTLGAIDPLPEPLEPVVKNGAKLDHGSGWMI
jgi:hypothetical protein